jgi:CAAX prenyl protease-like protein
MMPVFARAKSAGGFSSAAISAQSRPMSEDDAASQGGRRGGVSDEVAYILPMGIFLLLTYVGGKWPSLYIASYVAKTFIVAIVLWLLWGHYTPIRWTHAWLGVIVGIIGVVQWVGMENALLSIWPNYPRLTVEPFNPMVKIADPLVRWAFIIVRWGGAALLVPVMEELFWRDYLWRTIASPNDFELVEVGEWDPAAFFGVPLAFSLVHVQWLTAIVWGLMIALLLLKTRSLGACMIAHGVTNLLLGAWVLYSHDWSLW